MKILEATLNYDHPQRGMLRALRALSTADVASFDYWKKFEQGLGRDVISQEFVELALAERPDWIWLQLQDSNVIQPEALLEIKRQLPGTVLVHWTGDARPAVGDYLSKICRATDLTLTSAGGLIPQFQNVGAKRAEYVQIGLDWEEDVLGEPAWEPPFVVPDVVFCGSNYGSSFPAGTKDRERAIRALQAARIKVGIVGQGWNSGWPVVGTCHVKQQIHVWRRAKVCLNVNHYNDLDRYYSDRQLIAMASGRPVVCHHVPGIEKEFEQGTHCVWYRDEAAMVAQVRRLLADSDAALAMGRAGREIVIREHTWFSRMLHVVTLVEAIKEQQ